MCLHGALHNGQPKTAPAGSAGHKGLEDALPDLFRNPGSVIPYLEPNGMVSWSQFMTPEEAETIRAYVAAQARTLQQSESREPTPSPLEPPVIERPVIDPAAIDPTAL